MEHEGHLNISQYISIYLNISQSLNISKLYIFQDISGIKSHCCLSLLAGKPLSTEVLWGAGGWGIGVRGSVRNPVRRLATCRRMQTLWIQHNLSFKTQHWSACAVGVENNGNHGVVNTCEPPTKGLCVVHRSPLSVAQARWKVFGGPLGHFQGPSGHWSAEISTWREVTSHRKGRWFSSEGEELDLVA